MSTVIRLDFLAPLASGSRFACLRMQRKGAGFLSVTILQLVLDLDAGPAFGGVALSWALNEVLGPGMTTGEPRRAVGADLLRLLGTRGWAVTHAVVGRCLRTVVLSKSDLSTTLLFYEPTQDPAHAHGEWATLDPRRLP